MRDRAAFCLVIIVINGIFSKRDNEQKRPLCPFSVKHVLMMHLITFQFDHGQGRFCNFYHMEIFSSKF